MKKFIDKILDIQTVFFIFMILLSLSSITSPTTSSMRYVTLAFGTPNVAVWFCVLSILAGLSGLIFAKTPIHYWVASIPFLSYCGIVIFSTLAVAPPLSTSAIVTFAFIIWFMMSITWGKINE